MKKTETLNKRDKPNETSQNLPMLAFKIYGYVQKLWSCT